MLNVFQQEIRPWHLVPRDALYLVESPEGKFRGFGDDRPTLATGLIAMGATPTASAVIVVAIRLHNVPHPHLGHPPIWDTPKSYTASLTSYL